MSMEKRREDNIGAMGKNPKRKFRILVRGAGDLATGTIHRLVRAGFQPLVLETDHPAAIRRHVAFSECIYDGCAVVEGVKAKRVESLSEAEAWLYSSAASHEEAANSVPVLVDPEGNCIRKFQPEVLIDAILAKRNLGTERGMAPLTIALGPGFTAGEDVDYVIETMRGHTLGRIYEKGEAIPNTGIPGIVGGVGKERVMHAPAEGILRNVHHITDIVEQGERIAYIECPDREEIPVSASISGLIRGLLRDGYPVTKGFKIADIDPRLDQYENCFTISDKARCIAGSVLELVTAEFIRKL